MISLKWQQQWPRQDLFLGLTPWRWSVSNLISITQELMRTKHSGPKDSSILFIVQPKKNQILFGKCRRLLLTIPRCAERNKLAIEAPGLMLQHLPFRTAKTNKPFTVVPSAQENAHEKSPKHVLRNTVIKSRALHLSYLFRDMYMCDRKCFY